MTDKDLETEDLEDVMIDESLRQRFGEIAIRSGFITKEQFIEAMAIQIENEIEGIQPKLIGSILQEVGFMTDEQINQVIGTMAKPNVPKCPNCGILILQCSNCGAHLR